MTKKKHPLSIVGYLCLLIVASAIVGCSSPPPEVQPTPSPTTSEATKLPKEDTPPPPASTDVAEKIKPLLPTDRAGKSAPQMPPAIEGPRADAITLARNDLAHRLHTDLSRISVVESVTRAPEATDRACLQEYRNFESGLDDLPQVQEITLSVKGNLHRYIALGDVIIYCKR